MNGLGQQNAFQNRFEFLNREKESTFGLNTIRLGARGYNPTTGRFDRTDPVTDGQEHLSLYQYGWNNPVLMSDPDGREPCCGGVVDFLTGAGQAIIEDVAGSTPIQANPGDAGAYNSGRTAGHLVAAIAGAGESALGLLGLGTSAVGEVGSLGLATPVVVATAAGSLALTAHGASTANNALNNLRNDKGRVEASGRRKETTDVPANADGNNKPTRNERAAQKKQKSSNDSQYGGGAEHTDGARGSTKQTHEEGRARNQKDKGGEKADERRYRTQDSKKKKD